MNIGSFKWKLILFGESIFGSLPYYLLSLTCSAHWRIGNPFFSIIPLNPFLIKTHVAYLSTQSVVILLLMWGAFITSISILHLVLHEIKWDGSHGKVGPKYPVVCDVSLFSSLVKKVSPQDQDQDQVQDWDRSYLHAWFLKSLGI